MLQVIDGGTVYDVDGRLAVIVRWLMEVGRRVVTSGKVQVTFDCGGSSVSVEVKERHQL